MFLTLKHIQQINQSTNVDCATMINWIRVDVYSLIQLQQRKLGLAIKVLVIFHVAFHDT